MDKAEQLIEITHKLAELPTVVSVAIGGSQSVVPDERSDVDVYVYGDSIPPIESRRALALEFDNKPELNNQFWETGDEWQVQTTGLYVDIMYRTRQWVEEQIDRVLTKQEASLGYSTCIWFNVKTSQVMHDNTGWFATLQKRVDQPYPEILRANIIAKNHPVLRTIHSSYLHQLESAVARQDIVSQQHRVTALLASYFDILFAVNRQPHPGEKRLISFVRQCAKKPARFDEDIATVISLVGSSNQPLLEAVARLLDGLDTLLFNERLIV